MAIYLSTRKQGVFGCFEVTLGWFGAERVDYLTYDVKEVWRCYEIKISINDFRSKSKTSFWGHYNYFVMPVCLYEAVKHEIPSDIGVYTKIGTGVHLKCVKKAKRRELGADERVIINSMIRSLYRTADKYTLAMKAKVENENK
jgi:hypothetical protein